MCTVPFLSWQPERNIPTAFYFHSETLADCFVSERGVRFSATGSCWQTHLLSYYSLQYVATKGQCAEKYCGYAHLLLEMFNHEVKIITTLHGNKCQV